jgi:hypothetical protein
MKTIAALLIGFGALLLGAQLLFAVPKGTESGGVIGIGAALFLGGLLVQVLDRLGSKPPA